MHSDVGGGYAQGGLSHVALEWMIERAVVYGLVVKHAERARLASMANPYDVLNNSRNGLGGYYRYKPRKFADLYTEPTRRRTWRADLARMFKAGRIKAENTRKLDGIAPMIHHSVFDRIGAEQDGYSPIVLPKRYRVVSESGDVAENLVESEAQAIRRLNVQERAFDAVWWRRVVYFATVFASMFLVAMPWIESKWPGPGKASAFEFLIPFVSLVEKVAPNFLSVWFAAFKAAPGRLAFGLAALAVLLTLGAMLEAKCRDIMRAAWRRTMREGPMPNPPGGAGKRPSGFPYAMRNSTFYRGAFYFLTHWLLPGILGVAMLAALAVVGTQLVSRTLFAIADVAGLICKASERTTPVASVPAGQKVAFTTTSLCQPTTLTVAKNQQYRVRVTVTDKWVDGTELPGVTIGPNGIGRNHLRP